MSVLSILFSNWYACILMLCFCVIKLGMFVHGRHICFSEVWVHFVFILLLKITFYVLTCSTCFLCFQAECYHYLFDAAIKLNQLGLDWSTPNHGPIQNVKGNFRSSVNRNISVKAGTEGSNTEFERVSLHSL